MKRPLLAFACLSLALFGAGCASTQSNLAPGTDLSELQTFYVQKLPADNRGVERLISDRLNTMGKESTYGDGENPPEPVDAKVTYQDRWTWDITMYMIQLDVQIRDGESNRVLASAQSRRPSMQRRSPEGMVEEVLDEIFSQ
ncbi:MAG: hypothetical protein JJU00_18195 [Opitutales bacterium]|nr:hypothetical protein [Opitutales bacterium]